MDDLTSLMQSYYGDDPSPSRGEKRSLTTDTKETSSKKRDSGSNGWSGTGNVDEEAQFETAKTVGLSFPALEVWLRDTLRKVHFKLECACKEQLGEDKCKYLALKSSVTLRNGDALFDQWLFDALLKSESNDYGLILPDAKGVGKSKRFLVQLLTQNMSSIKVDDDIVEKTVEVFIADVVKSLLKLNPPRHDSKKHRKRVTILKESSSNVELQFKKTKLAIRREHFDKLRKLFEKSNPDATEQGFSGAIFTLMQRYDTLGGHGFQAAISPQVFDVLTSRFDIEAECFASPLNCYLSRFCSAFPDTDAPFGSLGSFFDFKPLFGSFEANPPFVSSVVERMSTHILTLMNTSEEKELSLCFVVIVPSKFRETLCSSSFHRELIVLDHRSHLYLQGAQQKDKARRKVASTCDTDVHIIQTSRAMKKWPVTEQIKLEICKAFEQ